MVQYGTWKPYAGREALQLTLVLLVITGVLAFLGAKLRHPLGVDRPGKAVSALLMVMWGLSLAIFLIAASTYVRELFSQYGNFTPPASPIFPITGLSGLVTFVMIAFLTRRHGLKIALSGATVGTVAAPMIFEFPFDLIVMHRIYPPMSAQFRLLFFLPLFLVEISSLSLLTLSPLAKVSRFTLFSLAAMFLIFAVWALFGFSYPSRPIPFALNAASKILCFIASVTLFLPHEVAS